MISNNFSHLLVERRAVGDHLRLAEAGRQIHLELPPAQGRALHDQPLVQRVTLCEMRSEMSRQETIISLHYPSLEQRVPLCEHRDGVSADDVVADSGLCSHCCSYPIDPIVWACQGCRHHVLARSVPRRC